MTCLMEEEYGVTSHKPLGLDDVSRVISFLGSDGNEKTCIRLFSTTNSLSFRIRIEMTGDEKVNSMTNCFFASSHINTVQQKNQHQSILNMTCRVSPVFSANFCLDPPATSATRFVLCNNSTILMVPTSDGSVFSR